VNRKILVAILSLVVVVGLVLVGCSQGSSSTTTTTTSSTTTTSQTTTSTPIQTVGERPQPGTTTTPAATTTTTPKPTGGQIYGGILTSIATTAPPQFGWTPTFAAGEATGATPCIEALITYTKEGLPVPRLALSWEVDPNGKFVTFKLRQGVKFSDGTDFNAEAVKYNLDLELKLRPGEIPGLASTTVIDPYTIKLNLDYFSNNLWDRLGSRGLISSPKHLAEGEDACKFLPVGTGPFIFQEWQRDTYIKYTRNPNYWQAGKPYLDGYQILFISNAMTASATLRSQTADFWMNPSFKEASDLVKNGYNSSSLPGLVMGLAPDTKNPGSKFSDVKVRQALEYAIDRNALVSTLGYGYMTARTQFSPPGYLGYVESLNRKFDPAKAKQLLTEAGYPNGFKTKIVADAEFVDRNMMAAIQGYLGAVNINAEVDFADAGRYADWRRKTGWSDSLMFMRNGGFPWTPNLASFVLDTKRNDYASMARPAGLQELLDNLLRATTPDEQKKLAEQLETMLYDDGTFAPLYIQDSLVVEAPYVHDTGQFRTIIVEWTPEDAWVSPH
jgi:peptide/nickel transport system substrate-binding protein